MAELVETAELEAFTRTIDAGSLSRAATELGLPRPTVGRRLARLEEKLGVRLLRRTTRKIRLTDAGQLVLERARATLAGVAELTSVAQRKEGAARGKLRISTLPLGSASLDRLFVNFALRHPDVELEVISSERVVSFAERPWDAAIRVAGRLEPSLIARPLWHTRAVAVASKAYVDRAGLPRRVGDLAAHRFVLSPGPDDRPNNRWPLLRNGKSVRVGGGIVTNDVGLSVEAVRGGLGIGLAPEFVVAQLLASGEFVHVLPRDIGSPIQVSLVYQERELMPVALRLFIDALLAWARADLQDALDAVGARASQRVTPGPERIKR